MPDVISSRSVWFQPVAIGHRFQFDPDRIFDGNDRSGLEHEGREHRTELVNRRRIVAVHQHMPAPFADADNEDLDLEVRRRLPGAEDLKDALLGIFVFDGDPAGCLNELIMQSIAILLIVSPRAIAVWTA